MNYAKGQLKKFKFTDIFLSQGYAVLSQLHHVLL